jgi:putative drug exporter of the RND superfamily
MEAAGRAVAFSGITVAIGLLALIALPLPFLRSLGYGGMLIPLVSVAAAITLLPVVMAKLGRGSMAPPAHRRQGQPGLDALGSRRCPPPLGGGRGGLAMLAALTFAPPT